MSIEKAQVSFDPQKINEFIANAILQSHMGKAMDDRVNEFVNKMSSSYDNPLDPIIKRYITEAIETLVKEKYKNFIEDQIKSKITEEKVSKIVDTIWKRLADY